MVQKLRNCSLKNMSFQVGYNSKFKDNWDFLIMIVACWNVFWLPIDIAFNTEIDWVQVINNIVDICFILDMILVFRTTVLDEHG